MLSLISATLIDLGILAFLISELLEGNDDQELKIFKNNLNLTLNLSETYIDDNNLLKNLKGDIQIKDNKVFHTNISAFFSN